MSKIPTRIGILHALQDDGATEAALKYLVLYQNILQGSLEFSFLPVPQESALLEGLRASESSGRLDASVVTLEMPQFYSEYMQWATERAGRSGVLFDVPDVLIVLSRARFSNRYYFIGEDKWSIIALGDWDAIMAPPSVVESILTLLVEIGLIAACGEDWPRSHNETKGCLFDFTASLKEARYKALTGFICAPCLLRPPTSPGFSDARHPHGLV
jgi:hypothetical protein